MAVSSLIICGNAQALSGKCPQTLTANELQILANDKVVMSTEDPKVLLGAYDELARKNIGLAINGNMRGKTFSLKDKIVERDSQANGAETVFTRCVYETNSNQIEEVWTKAVKAVPVSFLTIDDIDNLKLALGDCCKTFSGWEIKAENADKIRSTINKYNKERRRVTDYFVDVSAKGLKVEGDTFSVHYDVSVPLVSGSTSLASFTMIGSKEAVYNTSLGK